MSDSSGTEKDGGLGTDGTIPAHFEGVGATLGDEKSHFNPEEDPESAGSDEVPEHSPTDTDAKADTDAADGTLPA